MRRIKLYAYCRTNLGDDLMVHILLKRYPQYQFFCEAENSVFENYANFLNIPMIRRRFYWVNHFLNLLTFNRRKDYLVNKIVAKMDRQCQCAIYIGGSLYMQHSNWNIDDQIWWEEKKLDKDLFVIGANFGPYWDAKFKDAFEAYFRKCAGVTFRDRYSLNLFEASLENVSYAPDVVFNLAQTENCRQGTKVVISVLDTEQRNALQAYTMVYEKLVADICSDCINHGKIPVLMSFCKEEGDECAIERIIRKMPQQVKAKTEVYNYSGNIEQALDLFRQADSVFATRFHAMILAIYFAKPFFCFAYNDKSVHFLEDLKCTNYCTFANIDKLNAAKISDLCRIVKPGDQYMSSASGQFAQFEEYMKKKEVEICQQ